MRGHLRWRIVPTSRLNKDEPSIWRGPSQDAWGAFTSPATLLIGVALRLLALHLQAHAVNLLRFNSQALKQLFTGLLIATKPTEPGAIGMLLAAVDAKSHDAPSDDWCR